MVFHLLLPAVYAAKCLWRHIPDVFYDTTGFPSALWTARFLVRHIKTFAYVHYPFISEDMVAKVASGQAAFNNSEAVARSALKTRIKLLYYRLILAVYRYHCTVMTAAQANSSWTFNHLQSLWFQLSPSPWIAPCNFLLGLPTHKAKEFDLRLLYPPCSIESYLTFPKKAPSEEIIMMSLAQFRPEKNQLLQLEILREFKKLCEARNRSIRLKMCGSTRGLEDQLILAGLRSRAFQLGLYPRRRRQDNVEFVVNESYESLQRVFAEAHIGVHTMEAEHFGISVVDMLAAGLIVVAHDSAGPKEDIVKDMRFLAGNSQEYVDRLAKLLDLTTEEWGEVIVRNRQRMTNFGGKSFSEQFLRFLHEHVPNQSDR